MSAPTSGLRSRGGAALLASFAVHAALADHAWWLSLGATTAVGLGVYLVLLPVVLPADERAILRERLRSVQI